MTTESPIRPVIRPEHLADIRSLQLRARTIVEGMIAGLHKSPYHGFSAEFSQYRPYFAGESVRYIDWRALGRTDRTVVKLFEDETNLRAHLLLDISASMSFRGRAPLSKLEYACTLAAAISWLFIRQRDATGLALFDDEIRTFIPPRTSSAHLQTIINTLQSSRAGASTRCGQALEQIAQRLTRRGLVVLISDLLDDTAEIIRGVRHLRHSGQDVIVLWIMDPAEHDFEYTGPLVIRDSESGDEIRCDGAIASEQYRAAFMEHRRLLTDACRDLRADCIEVFTSEPFAASLMRVVQKRRHLW